MDYLITFKPTPLPGEGFTMTEAWLPDTFVQAETEEEAKARFAATHANEIMSVEAMDIPEKYRHFMKSESRDVRHTDTR